MVERHLNTFSIAFLGVTIALFLFVFAVTPIVCGLGPASFIHLPFARTASVIQESERDLAIFVKSNHQVFISTAVVPLPNLATELAKLAAIAPDRHVLIAADESVPFGLVRQVLRASHEAGFRHFSLVTFRGNRFQAFRLGVIKSASAPSNAVEPDRPRSARRIATSVARGGDGGR